MREVQTIGLMDSNENKALGMVSLEKGGTIEKDSQT